MGWLDLIDSRELSGICGDEVSWFDNHRSGAAVNRRPNGAITEFKFGTIESCLIRINGCLSAIDRGFVGLNRLGSYGGIGLYLLELLFREYALFHELLRPTRLIPRI